ARRACQSAASPRRTAAAVISPSWSARWWRRDRPESIPAAAGFGRTPCAWRCRHAAGRPPSTAPSRRTGARSPARRRTSAPRSAAGQTSGGSWSGHLAGWTASVRRGLPVATKACRGGHRLVTKTRPMRPRSFTRRRQTRRGRGMMRIGLPRRAVALVRLVAPACPTGAGAAREQLEIGPGAACLDDGVLFVGLARMLALAGGEKIHLPTAGRKRARIPALDAEQDQFGHVAEVEADAAPVGAAVLAHLVPDEVGLVGEAP